MNNNPYTPPQAPLELKPQVVRPPRSMAAVFFFGFCWFLFFWFVVGGIFSGTMTVVAGKGAGQTFSEGYTSGKAYGEELGRKYGKYFFWGGLVASVLGSATGFLPGTKRRRPAQQSVQPDRREDAAPG